MRYLVTKKGDFMLSTFVTVLDDKAKAECVNALTAVGLPGDHPILDQLIALVRQYGPTVIPILASWLLSLLKPPAPTPPAPAGT